VIYLVWPPGETTHSEALGLADLDHEEALILDKLFLNAFKLGCIDCPLIQQVLSIDHPIRQNMPGDIPGAPSFPEVSNSDPLVPFMLTSNIKSSSVLTRDNSLKILNNSTIKSCLFLFSSFVIISRWMTADQLRALRLTDDYGSTSPIIVRE